MVKRYEFQQEYGYGEVVEDTHGEYVTYDDYCEAVDDMLRMKRKYEELVAKIEEIYREA